MNLEAIQPIIDHLKSRHQTERKLLYISGLTGAGKTTLSRVLGARQNAEIYSEFIDKIPFEFIKTNSQSFLSEQKKAQDWVITQHQRKNKLIGSSQATHIIVDRTWVDAIAYGALYSSEALTYTVEKIGKIDWEPGLFIFLIANKNSIKSRLTARWGISDDDWLTYWDKDIDDLTSIYQNIASMTGATLFDSTNLPPEEIAEQVIALQW